MLVVRAPQVLSYFNAGHHVALYQVADHLRRLGRTVDVLDASLGRTTWRDVAELLHGGAHSDIAILNDLDGIDGLERFIHYARSLAPDAWIVTFGRLSSLVPALFERFDLDAVVASGDFEAGVAAATAARATDPAPGIRVRREGAWMGERHGGALLDPEDWGVPNVGEIPYELYDELYAPAGRAFSGLAGRRELVAPVARGCPIGCSFCEVPTAFGRRERRLTVAAVINYIENAVATLPFDYVSFYAPTFTLDRTWVLELCSRFREQTAALPWKCCTTLHHLDPELIATMGAAGCVRISVGVETLDVDAHPGLPRLKRKTDEDLEEVAAACTAAGIELNCFVVVGLPGTTPAGTRATIDLVRALGGRVRATVYTPYDELGPASSPTDILGLNRQTFPAMTPLDAGERSVGYALVYGS